MDEYTRQMLEDVFALDDATTRQCEQWEATRAQSKPEVKQRELVYKILERPTPQQQSATMMDAATEARWNEWAQAHVQRALAAQPLFSKAQVAAIGQAISMLRKEMRDEFAAEIASLRADMMVQAGIARGEIAQIKGKADAA